jgi:hypothetical protein
LSDGSAEQPIYYRSWSIMVYGKPAECRLRLGMCDKCGGPLITGGTIQIVPTMCRSMRAGRKIQSSLPLLEDPR